MNARNLKGMESWTGVTIAHDLTKMEYQEERIQESNLRKKIEELNQNLSVEEKKAKNLENCRRPGMPSHCVFLLIDFFSVVFLGLNALL